MQGREVAQRQILDVEALAGELLAPGSVFAFLAEHRGRLFPDSMMEDLFPSRRGRPSIPSAVVGSVMVLQALQGLSDRETAEALTFDLRWKAACGFGLTDTAFHPSTLTYWRKRLAASSNPGRIVEAIAAVVTETGVLAGKRRRALDSTILDDAVARQDTITQIIAAVRRFGRDVPDGKNLVSAHARRYDYSRAGKPEIAWDDAEAREALVSALVSDALALLGSVDPDTLEDAGEKAQQAYALLALVSGQDVEPAEGSDGTDGRFRIARKVAPDRVISTVDTDARHAHKTRQDRRDGYKAHIVVEPDTGLVTAASLTRASGEESSDPVAGAVLLAADTTVGDGPVQVLADSAYGSAAMLRALAEAGHEALIKPKPLTRAVEGGFSLDDFIFDPETVTLRCPKGLVRTVTASGRATFGVACQGCPLRQKCTTSAAGRKIKLHPEHQLMQEHRAKALEPEFQADYRRHRPMVERSIAWLTRGNRRVPYRGEQKNHHWWILRAAVVNLKRLSGQGLEHRNGVWALA